LFILRTAVGSESCDPCVCDVDASGGIVASDSLSTLRAAVGVGVVRKCPACAVTGIAGSSALTLTSADSRLVVTIPAGALPAGTIVMLKGLPRPALPPELAVGAGAFAYVLEPAGLDLAGPGEVSFTSATGVAGGDGSFGAGAMLLFGSSGSEPVPLPDSVVHVDFDLDAAFTSATLAHTGTIVAAPIAGLALEIGGVPATSAVDSVVDVDAGVTHAGSAATYTDTSFDAFAPQGGAIDEVLPEVEPGHNAASYPYACDSDDSATYDAEVAVIYDLADLVDGVFGAGSSTSAASFLVVFAPRKNVTCD
jgi:hypothetical protein